MLSGRTRLVASERALVDAAPRGFTDDTIIRLLTGTMRQMPGVILRDAQEKRREWSFKKRIPSVGPVGGFYHAQRQQRIGITGAAQRVNAIIICKQGLQFTVVVELTRGQAGGLPGDYNRKRAWFTGLENTGSLRESSNVFVLNQQCRFLLPRHKRDHARPVLLEQIALVLKKVNCQNKGEKRDHHTAI